MGDYHEEIVMFMVIRARMDIDGQESEGILQWGADQIGLKWTIKHQGSITASE
jgi:hypothetical protein